MHVALLYPQIFFYAYYMQFHEKTIDALATEVAQRNLSIDLFQDFTVKYPKALKKQQQVVVELDELESVIDRAECNLLHSKQLQKSLINQIF